MNPSNINSSNIASKTVNRKLDSDEWRQVENQGSKLDQTIYSSIMEFSKLITNGTDNIDYSINYKIYDTLGDNLYIKIRNKFSDISIIDKKHLEIDNIEKIKKTKKKGMTADEIRESSTLKRINDIAEKLISSYSMKKFTPHHGLKNDIVEFIGMTYIYMIRFSLNFKTYFNREKNYPRILNLLVSTQRLIESLKNYKGNNMITPFKKMDISKQFMIDLTSAYDELSIEFPFDGLEVYHKCPKLLVWADLDKYIPEGKIEPRNHQKEIMIKSYEHFNSGFLIIYNAMIGSGKTTSVIGLARLVEHFRNTISEYSDLELLFVCNLDSVRKQVGNTLYNTLLLGDDGIKFGMATTNPDGSIKYSNHYSCKSEADRIVLITNPETANILLKQSDKSKYFLFHDEPTIGADIDNSLSLRSNIQVLMNLPKWTIFSSATAPEIENLTPITNKAYEENYKIIIDKVYSPNIQIGIDVRTFDHNLVSPFKDCKNKEELKKIIDTVREIPFLGRMFNSNIALTLWKVCQDYDIKCFPNIPELFKNVTNMKADKIRLIVINMLELILELDDSDIQKIASSKLIDYNVDQLTKNDIDFKKLGTTEAHTLDNLTLVATTNPYDFTLNNFGELLSYLKDNDNLTNFDKVYDKYITEVNIHKLSLKRLEEAEVKDFEKIFNRSIKELNKIGLIDTELIIKTKISDSKKHRQSSIDEMKRIIEIVSQYKVELDFPAYAQINTIEHENKFNETDIKLYNSKLNREKLDLNDIPFHSMTVTDDILILLLCGVGIYSPSNPNLDPNYLSTVLNLASKGDLAYIIADNSISYGTNYPISRVIITDEFSKEHSMYTMFQLMGRAGRVGKSWKATAYVTDELSNKISDFAIDPEKYNLEIKNINRMVQRLHDEHEEKINKELEKMEEKMMDEIYQQNTELKLLSNGNIDEMIVDIEKEHEKHVIKKQTSSNMTVKRHNTVNVNDNFKRFDKYEPKKYEPKKYDKYEPKKYESKKYEPKKYESKKYEPKKYESKKYEPKKHDKYGSKKYDKYDDDETKKNSFKISRAYTKKEDSGSWR
jgi:hypothetical protein